MFVILLLVLSCLGTDATPELCSGVMCHGQKTFGFNEGRYCVVTGENELITLPPGVVKDARECELYAIDSPPSQWYNFRKSGACEILSFCKYSLEEEGSVSGPDPGKGETCITEPTTSPPPQEVLLVIGGWGSGSGSEVDIITQDLDVISGNYPDVPRADYHLTAGLIGDQIVVCGGETNYRGECQHLNLTSRVWQTASTMQARRSHAPSTTHGGSMFVFGGWNGSYLSSVERYYSDFHSWALVPEWTLPEANADFCVVTHEDFIYIIGGLVTSERQNMTRLSTATNTWEAMPSMEIGRYEHACVVTRIGNEEGILVTGGWGGTSISNATEFFSFQTQKWDSLADMNIARYRHGIGDLNGRPVVFGGCCSTDSLEVYDDTKQQWLMVDGSTLPKAKYAFAYAKVPQWIP